MCNIYIYVTDCYGICRIGFAMRSGEFSDDATP